MSIKRMWYFLPAVSLPVIAMVAPIILAASSNNPALDYIMDTIFQDNPLILFGLLIPIGFLATMLSILGIIMSFKNEWDSLELARYAVIMKLIFVPAYGIIFILSLVLAFSLIFSPLYIILLFPIPVSLLLLNFLLLFVSNLLTTAAIVNANRIGLYGSKESAWIIVLQQFFYIDAIVAVVLYIRLKKRKITLSKQGDKNDTI